MFKNPSLVKLKCEAQQQVPLPAKSYRAHTLSLNAVVRAWSSLKLMCQPLLTSQGRPYP